MVPGSSCCKEPGDPRFSLLGSPSLGRMLRGCAYLSSGLSQVQVLRTSPRKSLSSAVSGRWGTWEQTPPTFHSPFLYCVNRDLEEEGG